mmetsp:Transcript_78875/g.255844  ORF Transcript_78875/g.255844 Transcript_78875/m.255844 type:complete len:274 (-) Transcript_78875:310-1131(-)
MGWAGILAFRLIATAKVHGRGPVRVQPSWTPRGAVVIARRSEHEPFPVVDGDTPKPKALKRDVCWHLERECVGLPLRRPREVPLVLGTGASPSSCNVQDTGEVIDLLRARKEAEDWRFLRARPQGKQVATDRTQPQLVPIRHIPLADVGLLHNEAILGLVGRGHVGGVAGVGKRSQDHECLRCTDGHAKVAVLAGTAWWLTATIVVRDQVSSRFVHCWENVGGFRAAHEADEEVANIRVSDESRAREVQRQHGVQGVTVHANHGLTVRRSTRR